MKKKNKAAPLDIAVIGIAGRFPDAQDAREFWHNLEQGIESRHEIPHDRWPLASVYSPQGAPGKIYSKWGSFLSNIHSFDAEFFGISADEAAKLDPQQRLSLEQAWLALEDAGLAGTDFSRLTAGVFAGARESDYHSDSLADPAAIEPQMMMGADTSLLAARIAHFLNLRGPVMTVNAACASVGVALHLACRSLRAGECEIALVGGAYLMHTPQRFLMHSRSGLLSPSGHCRPFDERADGITLGEAVGFVVIKRLEDALAKGDAIYGIIKATGVNHSGNQQNLSSPSRSAQSSLVRQVLAEAGNRPRSIGYVETHGTGTPKGDACEIAALGDAYMESQGSKPWRIGSVKSNIGHTITASLVPSLFKVLLSLRHKQLPPTLNFSEPNSCIRRGHSKSTPLAPWNAPKRRPRRAAISCFAYTGTNFHAVLEEAPKNAVNAPKKVCIRFLYRRKLPIHSADRSRSCMTSWCAEGRDRAARFAYTLAVRPCQLQRACLVPCE